MTDLNASIITTAQAMNRAGLSPQRSGNVSARTSSGFVITPSGMSYDTLTPEDAVGLTLKGECISGTHKPSSEWRLHAAIYATFPEAGAIVHCHSLNATTLACAGKAIPAFHYMVAVAGGTDIRCADYATFGTPELARNTVAALRGRRACLLANHGQVAFGSNLETALELAMEVETLAAQYLGVLRLGEVQLLDDEEMARVLEKFKSYGNG